jgi:hypothetical protein
MDSVPPKGAEPASGTIDPLGQGAREDILDGDAPDLPELCVTCTVVY